MQILLNILLLSLIYSVIGIGFQIKFLTTKFYDLSYAALISLSSYVFLTLFLYLKFPIVIAIIITICGIAILSLGLFAFILNPIRLRVSSTLMVLITSLGCYIVIQNIIAIIWGNSVQTIRFGSIKEGYQILSAHITFNQIIILVSSMTLILTYIALINTTRLGLHIQAIHFDNILASIFGINENSINFLTNAIGGCFAAFAGIFIILDNDINPTMGFSYLFYGIIAMIIGGIGNVYGLIVGSIFIATIQNITAYYFNNIWIEPLTYFVLILFLVIRPYGIRGNKLKKLEL